MSNTPTILAIETATSSCSVALLSSDQVLSRSEIGNNIHSQVILSMVQSILLEASIEVGTVDAVAVGQGPGSFTGLRIGIGVAQGLAYGAECPMIGVSSLDALAMQSTLDGPILAGIDARMGEIYWAEYVKNGDDLQRLGEIGLNLPIDIQSNSATNYILVGNAWSEYKSLLSRKLLETTNHLEQIIYPSAKALLTLALSKYLDREWVSAIDFTPEYVRNNVAEKPKTGNKTI